MYISKLVKWIVSLTVPLQI